MAKQQSSFFKLAFSAVVALVLVGGGVASMGLVQDSTDSRSNAWTGFFGSRSPSMGVPIGTPAGGPVISPESGSGVVCWNRVVVSGARYLWPNACKGMPGQKMCAQVIVPLTSDEIIKYSGWVQAGSPALAGCDTPVVSSPKATTRPIDSRQTPFPYPQPPSVRPSAVPLMIRQ